jgi:hypothetical protein
LLLCPNDHHYLWVGKSYAFQDGDVCIENIEQVMNWASSVQQGEIKQDKYSGQNLLNRNVSIVK